MPPNSPSLADLGPLLERLLLEPTKESRSHLESEIRSKSTSPHIEELIALITYAADCDVYRGVTLLDRYLGGSVLLDVSDASIGTSCRRLYDHLVCRIVQFVESGARCGLERLYVLAGAVLLLNVFVRVNWMGPPVGVETAAEKHLASQYREKTVPDERDDRVSLDSLDLLTQGGSSFAAFASEKVALEFNDRCVLRSPDIRCFDVEADGSAYASLVSSMLEELQVDGEFIYTGIVGAPYLAASLAFLSTLNGSLSASIGGEPVNKRQTCNAATQGTDDSDNAELGALQPDVATQPPKLPANHSLSTLGIWQGRAAFVWQRVIRDSMLNPCPTLFRACVTDFGEILKLSGFLPSTFSLSDIDGELLKSVNPTAGDSTNREASDATPAPSATPDNTLFLQKAIIVSPSTRINCSDELGALLIVELALRLPYYNMSRLFEPLMSLASSLLGFSFAFTGRLGIRRKHQVNALPQLVVVAENSRNPKSQAPDSSPNDRQSSPGAKGGTATAPAEERTNITAASPPDAAVTPEDIGLADVNEDTDILERPKLSEESDDAPLSLPEQCLLLSKALHILQTMPAGDELNLEFLSAIVARCLGDKDGPSSWLLSSVALWVRCKTEYHRTKTVERATLQLHKLSDSYYEADAPPGRRLEFMWHVWSPTSWGIKREIARRMSSIGSFLTAFEIYQKLHMWEDAIQCLIIVGRKNDAKELVQQHLKKAPSPLLWCFLGDVEGDISHYKTAWDLSKGRCARAQRTLGSYYYNKSDFAAAVEALELALAINPMRESSQFLLGCAYLKQNNLERALGTFARVVALNPANHDAWANMCSAHVNMGNFRAAMLCIDQAVKFQPSKWEFWDIRLRIALRERDLQNICQSIEKLIDIGKPQKSIIEPPIVAFLVESSTRFPTNHATQRMLARTLDLVTKHITGDAEIWRLCARYFGFQKFYKEALECTFRQYRAIESAIVDSLSEAKQDADAQRAHDVAQLKRLTDCLASMVALLKRMSVSDRRGKRDTVLQTLRSVRERAHSRIAEVNAQFQAEMDSFLESAEVEDVVAVYAGD
ncbi:tetratricopeptide repeat-containing protein [Babesia caballi]|uniref:Tetratricopeptide repeat-containing protein n=1 Tax=Babesia caballi TaxID=5871 RepID=A0AAV4M1U9_BABCB|nr:tetratricopeptide repeat-containing protein [Babesia caballi]